MSHSEEEGALKELAHRALNLAQTKGATYADIRIIHLDTQSIAVKNGIVEGISQDTGQGFGVRVIADGAWGFASGFRLEREAVDRTTALAIEIATAAFLIPDDFVKEIGDEHIAFRYLKSKVDEAPH